MGAQIKTRTGSPVRVFFMPGTAAGEPSRKPQGPPSGFFRRFDGGPWRPLKRPE
ncbi:hypothetical protein CVCC1112_2383 [Paenarthrobacter nicotinovorans]|nr:hypothetical protein CVCC1112_2383 [Paenarthrobacter nicotinovorans]